MGKPIDIGVATYIGKYSDAIEVCAGKHRLHVAGTPGIDSSGIVPASFDEQAHLAWQNLLEILVAADMGVANAIKINQTLVRVEDIATCPAIRQQYLGGHRPASMLSVVSSLVRPDILFQTDAVASGRVSKISI